MVSGGPGERNAVAAAAMAEYKRPEPLAQEARDAALRLIPAKAAEAEALVNWYLDTPGDLPDSEFIERARRMVADMASLNVFDPAVRGADPQHEARLFLLCGTLGEALPEKGSGELVGLYYHAFSVRLRCPQLVDTTIVMPRAFPSPVHFSQLKYGAMADFAEHCSQWTVANRQDLGPKTLVLLEGIMNDPTFGPAEHLLATWAFSAGAHWYLDTQLHPSTGLAVAFTTGHPVFRRLIAFAHQIVDLGPAALEDARAHALPILQLPVFLMDIIAKAQITIQQDQSVPMNSRVSFS